MISLQEGRPVGIVASWYRPDRSGRFQPEHVEMAFPAREEDMLCTHLAPTLPFHRSFLSPTVCLQLLQDPSDFRLLRSRKKLPSPLRNSSFLGVRARFATHGVLRVRPLLWRAQGFLGFVSLRAEKNQTWSTQTWSFRARGVMMRHAVRPCCPRYILTCIGLASVQSKPAGGHAGWDCQQILLVLEFQKPLSMQK